MAKKSNSLASFAGNISGGYHTSPWPGRGVRSSSIRIVHSRQATLHTARAYARCAPHCRFIPRFVSGSLTSMGVRPPTKSGLHTGRVGAPMPLEVALQMQTTAGNKNPPRLPPAPTRNWAFQADTRGFIDMPFKGFLGPSWEPALRLGYCTAYFFPREKAHVFPLLYQVFVNFSSPSFRKPVRQRL